MADIAFRGTHILSKEDKYNLLGALEGLGYPVSKCSLDSSDASTRSLVFMEEYLQFLFDKINPGDQVEAV